MTQDELREAVLAALLDYETLKKTRRLKAVKKALRGTVMATVIGGAGITAANQGRGNQVSETVVTIASNPNAMTAMAKSTQGTRHHKIVVGVAHFDLNRHTLASAHEERLMEFIKQLPKDAELTVIGRTDSLGQQDYNKKLGMRRAQSVASYLARHGMKIKAIGSKVSKNKHGGWMARRVDIFVDSALAPFAINLPPLAKQHPIQQSETHSESQIMSTTIDYHDAVMKVLYETQKPSVAGKTKMADAKSYETTVIANTKPDQQAGQRQIVAGVTHFALNRHTLASAHKERLIELIKQLPNDAELTVIGRTDAHGGHGYNKNLGMQRAQAVANFLATQGVKIKAIGSKVSSSRLDGWMARCVDIAVDSALTPLAINLPPLVKQQPIQRSDVHPKPQPSLISAINGRRAVTIEKDITRLVQHARYVFNVAQTGQTFEDATQ
jgi:outer membrane protein OmpA-like peptidoglycan-associated protein